MTTHFRHERGTNTDMTDITLYMQLINLLIDCACYSLNGHAGLCYIMGEAQPIMADL